MPETWEGVSVSYLHVYPENMQQYTKYSADFKNSRFLQNITAYTETQVIYNLFLSFPSKDLFYFVDLGAKNMLQVFEPRRLPQVLTL